MTDTPETREAKYERQTTEQFAALGRFVQAFELMVNEARTGCLQLTATTIVQQALLQRVFNHSAMSAMPLFDMYRALITTIVSDYPPIGPDNLGEKNAALSILKQMADEYQKLAASRNDLVHGTWFIGFHSDADVDFSALNMIRSKWDAQGKRLDPPVASVKELNDLTARCEEMEHLLSCLITCLLMSKGGTKIQKHFRQTKDKKKRWFTTIAR